MLNPLLAHAWASSPERLAIAAGVTLGFAVLARVLRGVHRSGALAGGLACFLLFAGAGPAAFATLTALFLMTWVSTRLGYRRKLALGLAEQREGRNAWQVLANLAWAALGSVVFSATGNRLWLVAAMGALAEAATDTVASEIGQYRGSDPRLITTWERVPAGTDGGITISGSIAGMAAGLVIAAVATVCGMLPRAQFWIPVAAGFAGMLIDSLLGATLQRRGWLSNQAVNLFSTLAAAGLAYALAMNHLLYRRGLPRLCPAANFRAQHARRRRVKPRLYRRFFGGLRSLLDPVEQQKDEDAQQRVRDARQEFVRPTPCHVQSDQAPRDQEVNHFVHHVEENRKQKS